MKNLFLVIALFGFFGATNVYGQVQIDGDWSITKATMAGESVPKSVLDTMKLKITGQKFDATSGDNKSKGMISVESRGRGPVKAVFKIESGDDSGQEIMAIFQLIGSELKIAFSSTEEYPSNFNSTAENGIVSLVYKNNSPPQRSRRGKKEPRGLPEPGMRGQ